jgi:hypothetical protein
MVRSPLPAVVVVLALAGCGGDDGAAPVAAPKTAPTTTIEKCKGSKSPLVRTRKIRRLRRELAALRRLAAPIAKKTFNGTPALSAAVDRFLVDVRDRDIPVHARSRLIDHAAAILAPVCEQCFQALEANRPTGGGANLGCG